MENKNEVEVINADYLENLPNRTALLIKCPLSKEWVDVYKIYRGRSWDMICCGTLDESPETKRMGETCCWLMGWICEGKPLERTGRIVYN